MPRGDRTGPAGMGPMTGRGAGYCAGYDRPGYANPWGGGYGGRGFGGGGRGWRNMYYATGLPGWARAGYAPAPPSGYPYGAPAPADEAEALRAQAEALSQQLDAIRSRLEDLEKSE
ncbi:MAG: DUF5320 domain-containing protein [Anaerolineae bacterium]